MGPGDVTNEFEAQSELEKSSGDRLSSDDSYAIQSYDEWLDERDGYDPDINDVLP